MGFDKSKIKANFNKYSCNYNSFAILQKKVAQNLCEMAQLEIEKSHNIIDLGSGSGFIAAVILEKGDHKNKNIFQLDIAYDMLRNNQNKKSNIFNINGDIENLPFRKNSFDLAISSLAFQWLDDLSMTFKGIKEIANNKSSLIFSIFIDETLLELKESVTKLKIDVSVNNFINLNNLEIVLKENFDDYQIVLGDFIMEYKNIYELLNSMKKIGASYSTKTSADLILKKGDLKKLNDFYLKNYTINNQLRASWKVAYVKAYIN